MTFKKQFDFLVYSKDDLYVFKSFLKEENSSLFLSGYYVITSDKKYFKLIPNLNDIEDWKVVDLKEPEYCFYSDGLYDVEIFNNRVNGVKTNLKVKIEVVFDQAISNSKNLTISELRDRAELIFKNITDELPSEGMFVVNYALIFHKDLLNSVLTDEQIASIVLDSLLRSSSFDLLKSKLTDDMKNFIDTMFFEYGIPLTIESFIAVFKLKDILVNLNKEEFLYICKKNMFNSEQIKIFLDILNSHKSITINTNDNINKIKNSLLSMGAINYCEVFDLENNLIGNFYVNALFQDSISNITNEEVLILINKDDSSEYVTIPLSTNKNFEIYLKNATIKPVIEFDDKTGSFYKIFPQQLKIVLSYKKENDG